MNILGEIIAGPGLYILASNVWERSTGLADGRAAEDASPDVPDQKPVHFRSFPTTVLRLRHDTIRGVHPILGAERVPPCMTRVGKERKAAVCALHRRPGGHDDELHYIPPLALTNGRARRMERQQKQWLCSRRSPAERRRIPSALAFFDSENAGNCPDVALTRNVRGASPVSRRRARHLSYGGQTRTKRAAFGESHEEKAPGSPVATRSGRAPRVNARDDGVEPVFADQDPFEAAPPAPSAPTRMLGPVDMMDIRVKRGGGEDESTKGPVNSCVSFSAVDLKCGASKVAEASNKLEAFGEVLTALVKRQDKMSESEWEKKGGKGGTRRLGGERELEKFPQAPSLLAGAGHLMHPEQGPPLPMIGAKNYACVGLNEFFTVQDEIFFPAEMKERFSSEKRNACNGALAAQAAGSGAETVESIWRSKAKKGNDRND
ncbi:hypothetical protein B0H16DRAFT_1700150 [Mycena metata]|uniref:Uncharacterized protein n=1 Tax=Mycena metata TaxID=1033252 RepID=A0AAD7HFV0_9AGAR|nr:hypothetical protein B0H16DRAFT_1700150 [Mycena metata]